MTPDPAALLAAYDAQLRTRAEVRTADRVDRAGPLWRAASGARGFVTYAALGGLEGAALDALIADTVRHYAADPAITHFEWKTRGHDAPADLPGRLIAHGLRPDDVETVMIGEAERLAQNVPLPAGVRVRRVTDRPDVEQAAAAQEAAFGYAFGVEDFLRRLTRDLENVELWVAEKGDTVLSVGRLEVVPGTDFAGLWGGGTRPEWRGQGLYRALTAARARSALARGVRYLHSDCTEYSRPILERAGMQPVTTTTPFNWSREWGEGRA